MGSRCRSGCHSRKGVLRLAACQPVSTKALSPMQPRLVLVDRTRRPLMHPMSVCIVARHMSRSNERARTLAVRRSGRVLSVLLVAAALLGSAAGCDEIEAYNQARQAKLDFSEAKFIDAAGGYEQALKVIKDDPKLHYNLGFVYSKIFKSGYDAPILL